MIFPTLLYKTPGPFGRAPGFKWIGCNDADELAKLKTQGWHLTKAEAMGKVEAEEIVEKAEELEEILEEVSPVGRKALELQAKKLKVGFNSRTSDEALAKRIAEKQD